MYFQKLVELDTRINEIKSLIVAGDNRIALVEELCSLQQQHTELTVAYDNFVDGYEAHQAFSAGLGFDVRSNHPHCKAWNEGWEASEQYQAERNSQQGSLRVKRA